MQRLGQTLDHVAGFANLAALDRRVGAEGWTDEFAQCLGAIDNKQLADRGVEPALDQIVDQGPRDGDILGCPPRPGRAGAYGPLSPMPRAANNTRWLSGRSQVLSRI